MTARLGEASVDGERRHLVVTGADLRSRFDDLETSRHARSDEVVAGDETELWGFTAVLGEAPNGGDEQDRRARVCVWEEVEQRRKKFED
jgi:hypothetical protein